MTSYLQTHFLGNYCQSLMVVLLVYSGNIPVDFSAAPSGGASAPDSVPTSSANPVVQAGSRRLASASARRRLLTAPAPSPGGIPRACTKSTLPGYDCEVVADASLGLVKPVLNRNASIAERSRAVARGIPPGLHEVDAAGL